MKIPTQISPRISLCALACLSVTACVSDKAPDFDNAVFYQAGFNDGCQSAIEGDKSFSTKIVRDYALHKTDEGYRTGWRQGYVSCNEGERRDNGTTLGQQDPFL